MEDRKIQTVNPFGWEVYEVLKLLDDLGYEKTDDGGMSRIACLLICAAHISEAYGIDLADGDVDRFFEAARHHIRKTLEKWDEEDAEKDDDTSGINSEGSAVH